MNLIDTHVHLQDRAFDEDRDAVVERMHQAGVQNAVTIAETLEDSARALACAKAFGLRCSVGVHPHEAKNAPADLAAAFGELLNDPLAVAIGETGLDYHYDHSPREQQQRVFREQIELARQTRKPLVFHHREAFEDFVAILREMRFEEMRGVVHCFSADEAQARSFVDEFGFYLGIGGVATFKNAGTLRSAIAAIGLDHLVLETDAPYLAPVPHRGKRNEPAYVADTARAVGEILGVDPVEVAARTTANARTLFCL